MAGIDKNRLIKGQVFLWPTAKDWSDLWDEDGTIAGALTIGAIHRQARPASAGSVQPADSEAPGISVTIMMSPGIRDSRSRPSPSSSTAATCWSGTGDHRAAIQATSVSRVNEIARGLKTSRTMTVGILIPDLENVFFTSIVAHIENTLQRAGTVSLICDYREDVALERENSEFLARNRSFNGFIYMPLGNQGTSLPTLLNDRSRSSDRPSVAGARRAIRCSSITSTRLTAPSAPDQSRHRRIGIIAGPPGRDPRRNASGLSAGFRGL